MFLNVHLCTGHNSLVRFYSVSQNLVHSRQNFRLRFDTNMSFQKLFFVKNLTNIF